MSSISAYSSNFAYPKRNISKSESDGGDSPDGDVGLSNSASQIESNDSQQRNTKVQVSDVNNHTPLIPPTGKPPVTKQIGKKRKQPASKSGTAKTSKRTSLVWNDFSLPNADGKGNCSCFHCGKTYTVDINATGTSTLVQHTRRCKKKNPDLDTQKKLAFVKSDSSSTHTSDLKAWCFDQQACKLALVKFLVLNELPFRFVESEGFRLFLNAVCPMFVVPSRSTVHRATVDLYLDEKAKLKTFFKKFNPRVCLTTDTWTSVQQINYLCLTLHFIDEDWFLHKKIINFTPIVSHKGEDIGKTVEKCLFEWGVCSILTVTVDNASSNDTALAYLKKKFNNGNNNICDGKFMHMRCIAHIINLVVNDGINLVGKSVEKIRSFIRFVRQSPGRIEKFKQCALQKNVDSNVFLCLDVPTRWNSTYLMLKSACVFETVFELFADEDGNVKIDMEHRTMKGTGEILGMLDDDDWIEIKRVMKFLHHFYDLTIRVSGSSYSTSNLIIDEIGDTFSLLSATINGNDPQLAIMARKMKDKYDKYWGDVHKINLLIFIARVFDPRNKLRFIKYVVNHMYSADDATVLYDLVDKSLHDMFDVYMSLYGGDNSDSLSQQNTMVDGQDLGFGSVRGVFNAQFADFHFTEECSPKSELDRYLKEELESPRNPSFNILLWWKGNTQRFPIISRMARDILAIPISTVSSESAFSTGGRVLTDYRSSMKPTTVETLICTQDWIRGSTNNLSLYLDEYLKEVEHMEADFEKFVKLKQ